MQWFTSRILALWFVLVLAIGAAKIIGRQQPPSKQLAMLHLSDCQPPCWIGIIPGKTTLAEARKRARTVYGSATEYDFFERSNGFDIFSKADDSSFSANLKTIDGQAENHVVYIITLFQGPTDAQPTIGELVSILGNPSLIFPTTTDGRPSSVLFGSQIDAMTNRGPCGEVSLYQRIVNYSMYVLPPDVKSDDTSYLLPWRGFSRCNSSDNP